MIPARVGDPGLTRSQTLILGDLFDEAIACDRFLAGKWESIYSICGLTRVPRYTPVTSIVTLDADALEALDERLFSLRLEIARLCAVIAPAAIRTIVSTGRRARSLPIRFGDLRDPGAKTLLRQIYEEAGIFNRLA